MKKVSLAPLSIPIGLAAIVLFAVLVSGQSSVTYLPGGLLSACPAPSVKALIFCNVAGDSANPDGAYVSANGASYFRVSAAAAGGVTSWNGATGAVVYKPSTINCSTATQSNTGLAASGCTIQ